VDLSTGVDAMKFATASSVTGTWADHGRHSVAPYGHLVCGGAAVGYIGEFSVLNATKSSAGFKVTAAPYFAVQSDVLNKTCTGLGGPPYATSRADGNALPNKAVFEFDPGDLGAGPITLPVEPT